MVLSLFIFCSMECIYYRRELLTLSQNPQPATCVKLGVAITHLEWTLLILSAFNLGREVSCLAIVEEQH